MQCPAGCPSPGILIYLDPDDRPPFRGVILECCGCLATWEPLSLGTPGGSVHMAEGGREDEDVQDDAGHPGGPGPLPWKPSWALRHSWRAPKGGWRAVERYWKREST